jgi:predicted enzyme related to lactoylglutathione lyase
MTKIIHFEIKVDNIERAKQFYFDVFGWHFQDYSDFIGKPYFAALTGDDNGSGINVALTQRERLAGERIDNLNSSVVTIGVSDYDTTDALIVKSGGSVATEKYALPGMSWQGYYLDTEGNIFGINEQDDHAK